MKFATFLTTSCDWFFFSFILPNTYFVVGNWEIVDQTLNGVFSNQMWILIFDGLRCLLFESKTFFGDLFGIGWIDECFLGQRGQDHVLHLKYNI